jgi:hypothetical protein
VTASVDVQAKVLGLVFIFGQGVDPVLLHVVLIPELGESHRLGVSFLDEGAMPVQIQPYVGDIVERPSQYAICGEEVGVVRYSAFFS